MIVIIMSRVKCCVCVRIFVGKKHEKTMRAKIAYADILTFQYTLLNEI